MPKIQNVGVGNYIRNPKGVKARDSLGMSIEVLKVESNEGNSFKCVVVSNASNNPVLLDTTRYYMIPIDTQVEQVSV